MNKLILALLILFLPSISNAQTQAINPIVSAVDAYGITDNTTTHLICRAVWIGTTQPDDFYINGHWVLFQGATAGTVIPIQATGARVDSSQAAPSSGDVVFLY